MITTYNYINEKVEDYPLDSDTEVDDDSDSYNYFDEEKCKIRGMHKN